MPPEAIFAAIVIVPVVLIMLLRINAALVFLTLCLGSVLTQFVSPDANAVAALFSAQAPGAKPPDNNTLSIALLTAPAVLTAIFMIKTVHTKSKLLINALPAAGVGILGALLIVPLLPPGVGDSIINSSLWDQAQSTQGYIVGLTSTVCLLVLWMQRPKAGHAKHGKHHKG